MSECVAGLFTVDMELIGERLKGILVCIGGRSGIRQSKAVGGLFTMVGYPPFGDPISILNCICQRSPHPRIWAIASMTAMLESPRVGSRDLGISLIVLTEF